MQQSVLHKANNMNIHALDKNMKNIKPIDDSAYEFNKWYCIGAVVGLLLAILAISFAFWLAS